MKSLLAIVAKYGFGQLVDFGPVIDGDYTFKCYESEKAAKGDSCRQERVALEPLSMDLAPIMLTGKVEGRLHAIAEPAEMPRSES